MPANSGIRFLTLSQLFRRFIQVARLLHLLMVLGTYQGFLHVDHRKLPSTLGIRARLGTLGLTSTCESRNPQPLGLAFQGRIVEGDASIDR